MKKILVLLCLGMCLSGCALIPTESEPVKITRAILEAWKNGNEFDAQRLWANSKFMEEYDASQNIKPDSLSGYTPLLNVSSYNIIEPNKALIYEGSDKSLKSLVKARVRSTNRTNSTIEVIWSFLLEKKPTGWKVVSLNRADGIKTTDELGKNSYEKIQDTYNELTALESRFR